MSQEGGNSPSTSNILIFIYILYQIDQPDEKKNPFSAFASNNQ